MVFFQVLNYLKPDRIECRDKMEKMLAQLNWPKFPGLQSLIVKVCLTLTVMSYSLDADLNPGCGRMSMRYSALTV